MPKNQQLATATTRDIVEGSLVSGVLKSIKGHCLFLQVGVNERIPQIGRLHRLETQGDEFGQLTVGDRVPVKVLRVVQGKP